MKYFKCDKTSAVYAFEADGSQDHLIHEGLVLMTDAEIAEHLVRNSAKDEDSRRPVIMAELARIDAASARPLRAILVGSATAADRLRLTELDEQAAALRAELAALESPPAA